MFQKIQKTIIQQRKKVLIMFDDLKADLGANKTLKPMVAKLFIR